MLIHYLTREFDEFTLSLSPDTGDIADNGIGEKEILNSNT